MAKKRKTNAPPKDETKAEKFVRVVTPRVNKAVKAINQIGNCAGAGYQSTTEQVEQLFKALTAAIKTTADKYSGSTTDDSSFKFGD